MTLIEERETLEFVGDNAQLITKRGEGECFALTGLGVVVAKREPSGKFDEPQFVSGIGQFVLSHVKAAVTSARLAQHKKLSLNQQWRTLLP
jgi:hypothetical protein